MTIPHPAIRVLLNVLVLSLCLPISLSADDANKDAPNWLDKLMSQTNGTIETYNGGDGSAQQIYVLPGSPCPDGKKKPVIILYHGGGWGSGGPVGMVIIARAYVKEGYVAVAPGTRLMRKGDDSITLHDVMEDAYLAAAWVRANADEYGIDPDQIILGGGSAGGHLACSVAMIGNPNDPTQKPIPTQALVLYNPVVDTGPGGYGKKAATRASATGDYKEASPVEHVTSHSPPAIIFHGTADKVVEIENARKFRDTMVAAGVQCELHEFEGAGHGFFNKRHGQLKPYAVAFLAEISPTTNCE